MIEKINEAKSPETLSETARYYCENHEGPCKQCDKANGDCPDEASTKLFKNEDKCNKKCKPPKGMFVSFLAAYFLVHISYLYC